MKSILSIFLLFVTISVVAAQSTAYVFWQTTVAPGDPWNNVQPSLILYYYSTNPVYLHQATIWDANEFVIDGVEISSTLAAYGPSGAVTIGLSNYQFTVNGALSPQIQIQSSLTAGVYTTAVVHYVPIYFLGSSFQGLSFQYSSPQGQYTAYLLGTDFWWISTSSTAGTGNFDVKITTYDASLNPQVVYVENGQFWIQSTNTYTDSLTYQDWSFTAQSITVQYN